MVRKPVSFWHAVRSTIGRRPVRTASSGLHPGVGGTKLRTYDGNLASLRRVDKPSVGVRFAYIAGELIRFATLQPDHDLANCDVVHM